MSGIALAAAAAAGAVLLAAGFVLGRLAARRGGRSADPDLGTPVERATFHTLHTASLAAPPLRAGLTEETARRAAGTLRSLLGTEALCLTDRGAVLAWDGPGEDHHRAHVPEQAAETLETGRSRSVHTDCADPACPLRWAVIAPLTGEDGVLGALVAYGSRESAVLVRAATEVARWASVQLELAELDRSRTRIVEAEIRALRAQISPHFIFNSSPPSPRSCAPTRNRRANSSSNSPTSPDTPSASTASSPSSPTNCGPSSSTWRSPGRASVTG